jgi:hypothetical protein
MTKLLKHSTAILQTIELFSRTSEESITPQQAYEAAGRSLYNPSRNKVWLRDRLTDLRKYGLIETTYSLSKGQRKLERILLTTRGKEAVGRKNTTNTARLDEDRAPTWEELTDMVKRYRRVNPDQTIKLESSLKEDIM